MSAVNPILRVAENGIGDTIHFDGGNARIKFNAANYYDSYIHAIAEITVAEYKMYSEDISGAFNPDLIQVHLTGGWRYFLVGDSAMRYATIQPRQGRLKYDRDYYGVMFASAVGRIYQHAGRALKELNVFASYPPSDKQFTPDLKECLTGHWKMIVGGTGQHAVNFEFEVKKVSTYPEPWGGLRNEALQWSAQRGSYIPTLIGKRIAVFDIGGGTHSTYWVDGKGIPAERRAQSFDMGINDVMQAFKTELESDKELRQLWRQLRSISPEMLREGIDHNFINVGSARFPTDGLNDRWFVKGSTKINVTPHAERAAKRLINSIMTIWSTLLVSGSDTDTIILSGGGSAILGGRIIKALGAPDMRYSGGDLDKIMFATVFGPRKGNIMTVKIA